MSSASRFLDPHANQRRLEQLLIMSTRLCDAIALDIAALEQGKFGDLRTADAEIEQLCAIYGREVKALKADGGVKGAPAQIIAQLKESGAKLNGLLARHERLVSAMRNAAEGLVQAVAQEVQKTRERVKPYVPPTKGKHGTGDAIVYNKVV